MIIFFLTRIEKSIHLFPFSSTPTATKCDTSVLVSLDLWVAVQRRESYNFEHFISVFLLLFGTFVCAVLTQRRNRVQRDLVKHRRHHEEDWIEVFDALAHSSKGSSGVGVREIALFSKKFEALNTQYVSEHTAVRDWEEDTNWLSRWLGLIAYGIILVWGGMALLAGRAGTPNTITLKAGQYSILLKLFSKFGLYLAKLQSSYIKARHGLISLKRLAKMMNLGLEVMLDRGCDAANPTGANASSISLRGVSYDQAEGVYGCFTMRAESELTIALGSFVRVRAIDETSLLTFFGLLGGDIEASKGSVILPTFDTKVLLSPFPKHPPANMTVHEDLMLAGAPALETRRLAIAFGLDPEALAAGLPPGQTKLLALAGALLRDPEILILPHPLSFVPNKHQHRIGTLLRLWQACGGTAAILQRLSDSNGTHETEGIEGGAYVRSRKTLIITDDHYLKVTQHPSDVIIQLNDVMEMTDQSMRFAGAHRKEPSDAILLEEIEI